MNTTQYSFRLTAVAVALMAVFGYAQAGEAEVNELIKPDSTVSMGIGNWSGNRPQMGIYDGMGKQGTYGLLDADVVKRDDSTGTWFKLKVNNFGLDNREAKAEYLRQGDIGATIEYTRISRDDPNTYTTRLGGIGTSRQTVSTALVPGVLQTVKLGIDRDIVSLGFYKNLIPDLDLNVSFKNENKKGNRAWGRGSAAEFAVEPINTFTRQLEATLNYTTKLLQLSGGYYGSWFDTKNPMVTVVTAGLGGTDTILSQPLDNQSHKLFLNGGYTFTSSTRGTFKYEYTRATMTDDLPYAGVAGFVFAGSPTKLNGRIDTTLLQLGVTSRPVSELSLAANLRYHDVKDKTAIYRFVQTNVACASGQCVDNTPLSYKTLTGKLEGTYRLKDGYSATAGLENIKQDRTVPVSNTAGAGGTDTQRVVPWRASVDETTYRLELRRSLSEMLNGSVTYLNSDRKGSAYIAAGFGPGGIEPDRINPINIADRKRHKIKMGLDWSPVDKFSIQANAAAAQDVYPENGREFGLHKGSAQLYGVDANYQFSDNWKVTAFYAHDRSRAKQTNSRNTAGIKDNDLAEIGDSLGLGLRGNVTATITLGADLQWTRNLSKYQQELTSAQTALFSSNLPDIQNSVSKLILFSSYALDKSTELRVDLMHERWKTNDWSWMFAGMTPFTYTGADGTTVTANQKQSTSFIGARYIYKFQ
jgi:MtrB/PioB family decaheme-associated outer membrane protein